MPSDLPRDSDSPNAQDGGRNRRATDRILSHWQHAHREGETMPSLSGLKFNTHEDVSKDSFLLRVDLALNEPVFILCGNVVCTVLNLRPLGHPLERAMPRNIRRKIGEACRRTFEEGQPVRAEGTYRNNANEQVRYRSIFAPVSSRSGDDAKYVFGTFGQNVFPAAA